MFRHRGESFKELQRETYEDLYSDLEFALHKVHHPYRRYFEHHIVSLSLSGLENAKHLSCLDIGCGQGVTTYVLSKHFRKVVGVDFSRGAVRTARSLLEEMDVTNATTMVGDVDHLGLANGSVDVVHCGSHLRSLCLQSAPGRDSRLVRSRGDDSIGLFCAVPYHTIRRIQ